MPSWAWLSTCTNCPSTQQGGKEDIPFLNAFMNFFLGSKEKEIQKGDSLGKRKVVKCNTRNVCLPEPELDSPCLCLEFTTAASFPKATSHPSANIQELSNCRGGTEQSLSPHWEVRIRMVYKRVLQVPTSPQTDTKQPIFRKYKDPSWAAWHTAASSGPIVYSCYKPCVLPQSLRAKAVGAELVFTPSTEAGNRSKQLGWEEGENQGNGLLNTKPRATQG